MYQHYSPLYIISSLSSIYYNLKMPLIILLILVSAIPVFSQNNPVKSNTKSETKLPPFYIAGGFGIPSGGLTSRYKNLYTGSLGFYLGKENQGAVILELGAISPATGYLGAGLSYAAYKSASSEFHLSENEISIGCIGAIFVEGGAGHGGGFGTGLIPEVQYLHRFTNLLGVSAGMKLPIVIKGDIIPFITLGIQFY